MKFVIRNLASRLLGMALLAACSTAYGAVTYSVFVDTSTISGVTGNLNFQFNPGGGALAASASVTGFTLNGGSFLGAPTVTGDVTGLLPGSLLFGNSTVFNDYFHPIQYGSSFQFALTLDGAALTPPPGVPAGTSFGIALFDNNVPLNALLTNTPDFIGIADINPDGTITITRFNTPSGGQPVVTFSDVPEPSTVLLTAAGLLLAGCLHRRRAA